MRRFFECVIDFFEEVLFFVPSMVVWVPLYCIPSVIQMFGFTKISFISFIVLLVLTAALIIYAVVLFVIAKRDEDVNMMNRCLITWVVFGGAALVGTLVAKLVGVF